eukprot:7705364-Alexandrium_andersonii.AAC.1
MCIRDRRIGDADRRGYPAGAAREDRAAIETGSAPRGARGGGRRRGAGEGCLLYTSDAADDM